MVKFIILHVPREPRFTSVQLQTVVDIFVGIGLIGLGSVAVPTIFERGSSAITVFGLVLSFVSWYIAVEVASKIRT